jgi:condensin-2 complex subunit D3
MAPEHKFATSARLCQEVLGAAADGALPLSECSEVIGDALRVLSCKGIKVAATRAPKDNDFDTSDPQADAQAIAGAAKGRLVSQMMKKHLVEAVVPVIIELKRMMEASRHPLLADLMAAAAAMLKDHKAEIEDILAADRQLAKEILYDIKQAEAAEAARAAEEKEIAAAGGGVQDAVAAKPSPAPAAAVPAKTPGTGGVAPAKTPHIMKNTPASAARGTPRSTRPPGTSGHSPIAAHVLRQTTSAGPGTEPGSSSQHPSKTPGSNPRRCTPATGGRATPGSGLGANLTGAAGADIVAIKQGNKEEEGLSLA